MCTSRILVNIFLLAKLAVSFLQSYQALYFLQKPNTYEKCFENDEFGMNNLAIYDLQFTVAGEAASRSIGSNIRFVVGASWMISPDIRQSFLLSSSTVFMFSIQIASTGPSNTSHFLFINYIWLGNIFLLIYLNCPDWTT